MPPLRPTLDRVLTLVLTISAAAVAMAAVRASFFSPRRGDSPQRPRHVENWADASAFGYHAGGLNTAPVTITVLFDLECRSCARYHKVASNAVLAHPNDVRLLYVNYPLEYHKQALPAARAADCASAAGRFTAWVSAVYAKQDSLGLKSWGSYARDAGIPDTAKIAACARSQAPIGAIERGLAFGESIRLDATPTVLVNGWVFPSPPRPAQLDSAVNAEIRRRSR